ncbi:MAG: M15 family metallopeptidase [Saprospiraceae bacterium]|nr:M15 family metallopeptidase [Saprospiraceae bacterium]MDW8228639.1 M15 family metallopeptidase [Saprospiraceae bacterium]
MLSRLFFLSWVLLFGVLCSCQSGSVPPPAAEPQGVSALSTVDSGRAFPLAELLGQFDPARHPDFVRVPAPYAARADLYLRREAAEAFARMAQAAQADGIALRVLSAARSFAYQKGIWERKWNDRATTWPNFMQRAQSILEYSAMPGASRHHWGTDVDLNALENGAFEPGGPHEKVYTWLSQHAHRFGFCQPYTPLGPERPTGYREEKWHWSYLPLAAPMLQQYAARVTDSLLTGFAGAETAASLSIVQNYVLGINAACR